MRWQGLPIARRTIRIARRRRRRGGCLSIEKRAEEEGAEIFRCDETEAAADGHPGYGYAREGQAAEIEVPDPRLRVNQISAISNRGAVRFMTYAKAMNAALFLVLLERLLRGTTGKIFLMVDRLQAHQTPGVKAWRGPP